MFFHARNTNMETTQLSHSSSESLKSATMIQLFPQKIFILHKIIGTVSCEGGRGAILRYRSFLHSDPGAMRGIDTIRRDVPAFFGHLLLVWHFVWLSKNTKLINHFLKPGFSDFTFVLSPVSFPRNKPPPSAITPLVKGHRNTPPAFDQVVNKGGGLLRGYPLML